MQGKAETMPNKDGTGECEVQSESETVPNKDGTGEREVQSKSKAETMPSKDGTGECKDGTGKREVVQSKSETMLSKDGTGGCEMNKAEFEVQSKAECKVQSKAEIEVQGKAVTLESKAGTGKAGTKRRMCSVRYKRTKSSSRQCRPGIRRRSQGRQLRKSDRSKAKKLRRQSGQTRR